MIRRLLRAPALLLLPVALIAGACTERLDTADGCPALCPGQQLEILDTLLDPAVVLDTTLVGFPLIGFEAPLLLASRGDTLDVRAVVRFDSLARGYRTAATGDSLIPATFVDSVTLSIQVKRTKLVTPATFFIDAYDVNDTLLVDSIPTLLLPRFVPANLLGSVEVNGAALTDTQTVRIRLDTAKVRAIVTGGQFLRVGLQMRAATSGAVTIATSDDATNGPKLRYRVNPDTVIGAANITPLSFFPRTPLNVNTDYPDYAIVADAPSIAMPGRIAAGGLPAARTYLRFELPRWLTDSVAVLRAQLEFTQDPLRDVDPADTVVLRAQLVLASATTTDLWRAARLIAPAGTFVGDALTLTPGDSGTKSFEINGLVRAWRTVEGRQTVPSAIVLRTETEGSSALGVRFFGLDGPAALRPRLRVSYVPSIRFGKP